MKTIPIGVVNYEELQIKDYYIVDKTLMIEEFLTWKSKVTLITRPRRFGKTSNMSMMSEFFDINKKSEKIFKHTEIAKTSYYKEMNQYPTIFLSFANCKGDIHSLNKAILEVIRLEYTKYRSLFEDENSDNPYSEEMRANYRELKESKTLGNVNSSIKILSLFLYHHAHKKKVMIFIDEYDTPFIEAHVQGYYDNVKNDLSILLQSALKDNNSMEYAMLTGIQRVSKENVFSHLNNLLVCTVKDQEYAPYFGFTTEETKTLLEYYGLTLNSSVKAMYDGYNMGGVEIYNPWSIINYAFKKELIQFWVNTSSNTMIKEAMRWSDDKFKEGYESLIQNGYVDTVVNIETSFYEVKQRDKLWGLLVNAGYLTIEKVIELQNKEYRVRIPNMEVIDEFKDLIAFHLEVQSSDLYMLYQGIEQRNPDKFIKAYRKLLLANPSYHDLKSENSYHMFLLGICLYLQNDFEAISNREAGFGRSDILLKAKTNKHPSYVLEFKYSKEQIDLTQLATQAVEQIKACKYDFNLEGEVIYIGLAHHGKEVEMVWQE